MEKLILKVKNNADFLNGIWLESYVYKVLKNIPKIQDIACGIEIGNHRYKHNLSDYSDENKGNKNEFDIMFIANNKLHIIECKTQKMDRDEKHKPENTAYKLEALKDTGGIKTKKCLVSYCEVSRAFANRAKELNIEIIEGNNLNNLKGRIENWISK